MAERKSRSRRPASPAARKAGKMRGVSRTRRTANVPPRATRKGVRLPKAASRPAARRKASRRPGHKTKAAVRRGTSTRPVRTKPPAYDRVRRTLREAEPAPSPPSTLNLDRRGSAVQTGHAEIAQHLRDHPESGPALTGGDVDANWEEAYHSGSEAPGGDNPTPDQDVVDEFGGSLGVQHADAEELKGADKIEKRDRHRWELDPASSEDYRDRGKK